MAIRFNLIESSSNRNVWGVLAWKANVIWQMQYGKTLLDLPMNNKLSSKTHFELGSFGASLRRLVDLQNCLGDLGVFRLTSRSPRHGLFSLPCGPETSRLCSACGIPAFHGYIRYNSADAWSRSPSSSSSSSLAFPEVRSLKTLTISRYSLNFLQKLPRFLEVGGFKTLGEPGIAFSQQVSTLG